MKVWTIGAAALLVAVAGTAVAGDEADKRVERVVILEGPGGEGRAVLDADKDGAVTREEFAARHDAMFKRLDTNGDGRLLGDEFGPRGHGGPHRVEICRVKKPGDAEAKDVPCDGLEGGGREVVVRRHGPGGPGGHGGPGVRRFMMLRGGDGLDADKDGRVTFEELAAPMREHFAELDKNKDGALDEAERKAMHGGGMHRYERRMQKK